MPNTIAVPACPKCGGAMWDNREDKKNPKAPDFRCKDKACVDESGYGTALWLKDLAKTNGAPAPRPAVAAANAKAPHSSGGPLPWETEGMDAICTSYTIAYKHAASLARAEFGNDTSDTAVAAMAATIFIQAANKGALVG